MDRRAPSAPLRLISGALGRGPLLWRIAAMVGAAELLVATRDFVLQPMLATPADPQAALRNSALIAAVTMAVIRLGGRWTEPDQPAAISPSAPTTAVDTVLAALASLDAVSGDRPTTLAVHVGDPIVEVFWSGPPPAPPEPWEPSSTGWVWEADRRQLRAARPHEQPWALLVAAGATPTGMLWLNLAAFRLVAFGGDALTVAVRAETIVRTLEQRASTGGADLVIVDEPGSDPGAAPDERKVEQALSRLWRRRARGSDGGELEPLVVVAAAGPAIDRLEPAARLDPAVTLLALGDVETADLRLRCEDGRVTVPFLGDVALRVDGADPPVRRTPEAADDPGEGTPSPPADPPRLAGAADVVDVCLLGPVEVRGAAAPVAGKSLELVVYLACHPGGASDAQIRDALWPDQPPAPATWAQRVSVTRRALGVDADGSPRLRRFRRHVGRLSPTVRTDVSRLETALARCRGAESAAAVDALVTLLDDVRGRPFDATRGYGWVDEEGHRERAERAVIDAAHYVAERAGAAGDWEAALTAVECGLRACPASDLLLADRDEAAAAGGVSTGALATRALKVALKDLDARVGLTLPIEEPDPWRVTDGDA